MLKKKDEEITNANTTVMTLKNHVFKLVGVNFLCKKVAKDTAADVRTLKGELEQKPLFLKELKKIWDNESSDLPWSKGRYASSNTLLIDDSPYKALLNPPNNAIFPHPYTVEHVHDDGQGLKGELRVFLEGLAEAEDVPTYVASHPLGQPAITSTDRNWGLSMLFPISNNEPGRSVVGASGDREDAGEPSVGSGGSNRGRENTGRDREAALADDLFLAKVVIESADVSPSSAG
ncbi:hypothetical protein QJS10_CPA08g00535 [Acorus calamus]|uniref:FCP1 homology domain-containing protein n=1 Tax=Acorus calamus TaxID=4465 RepID=A0AAV9EBC6_ACOCL|nr:hypothetical protein QJS10_CPA08g00535 [Acorus calamus]